MVTDIDILVKLGYSRNVAKNALAEAKGDRSAALDIIRLGDVKQSNEWKNYKSDHDWRNKIGTEDLPKDSQMRALWKSPVTAHVNSFYRREDGITLFRCRVITHAFSWSCDKSLEDFLFFKSSLSLGSTFWFKTSLPSIWLNNVSTIFSNMTSVDTVSESEKIRRLLDDWIRELTLSEKCMSDEVLLQNTLSFLDIPKATASGGHENITSQKVNLNQEGDRSIIGRKAGGLFDGRRSSFESSFPEVLKKINTLHADSFPMRLVEMDKVLSRGPFKIDVSEFPNLAGVAVGSSGSLVKEANVAGKTKDRNIFRTQLEKDLIRDRLIINGTRYQGSSSSHPHSIFLDSVVGACVKCMDDILGATAPSKSAASGSVPLESFEAFSLNVLQAMSRTESAYVSLLGINSILDLSPTPTDDSNAPQPTSPNSGAHPCDEDDMQLPPTVIAESVLADPILINFQLLEKKASPPSASPIRLTSSGPSLRGICVDCEGQTSTVYRVCAGDQMDTLLQVRVIYSRRTFAMLSDDSHEAEGDKRAASTSTSLVEREGPVHLIFIRETKTTARDWR